MPNFNKVILAGNLTRDPELRYLPKGTAIVRFGLAINRTWKDEQGVKHEEVTFVDVDAFGKLAETIAQYLGKGRPVLVEGRLKTDSWTDKHTNQPRTKLSVILESFTFLDYKEKAGAGGSPAAPPTATPSAPSSEPAAEDDVPF